MSFTITIKTYFYSYDSTTDYNKYSQSKNMIFASEIAAAIGHNPYKNSDEIKINMWRRMDKESFELCIERTKTEFTNQATIVESVHISTENAIKSDLEGDATKEIQKIMEKPIRVSTEKDLETIKEVLNDDKKSTRTKRKFIKDMIMDTKVNLNANTKTKIQKTVDNLVISGASMSEEKIKKEIECLKVSDSVQLREAVNTVVNTSRGTQRESVAIEMYEKETGLDVTENNNKFYKADVGDGVMIGGRIDGFSGGKLIEVKCRRNRFFDRLPKYEKVQIHAYMFITGVESCDLVQKFDGKVRVDTYDFDFDYWEGICDQIISFWEDFKELMDDEEEQDELMGRIY